MDLRQLEYLVAVAEELSFTKASRRLRVVQSGVSTAIRALEREVGTPLFERDSRHVRLTAAGTAMLPHARAALAAARAAHDAARTVRGELHGSVTLGILLTTSGIDIPRVLGRFRRAHPHVRVRVQYSPGGSGGHVGSLLDGSLDLAFVAFPGRCPPGLSADLLAEEQLRLLCPDEHALTRAGEIDLAALADESFVDFPPGWGSRGVVDRAFEQAGLSRAVPLEVSDYATLTGLVGQGLGVAFVPESMTRSVSGVTALTVASPALRWRLSVATSATRSLSPAAAALLEEIRRCRGPVTTAGT
ncbi:LysR family transcriptional regulator [Amycolatopsis acididurans]|uniref:LysR family transcriptional regulator n=1 Tax=Amycolatopsis acididurans TaxID=2724524 RepID=UPI0028AE3E72|nr:LysR family transcriptional regulator [Amycolatopsis acididurans]